MWLQVTSSPKEDVKSSNNRLKGRREGTFHLVSQEDKKWIFLEMFESIKEYNLYKLILYEISYFAECSQFSQWNGKGTASKKIVLQV